MTALARGAAGPTVAMVRLDQVVAHPHNLRRDLGDLRSLTASIRKHGVMVPIIVEKYGPQLRLRAGHRRVTAARMANVQRVAAIIHQQPLDEEEWLISSVQENYQRRDLDDDERRRTVLRLRELNLTWRGIAEAFGVTEATVRAWTITNESQVDDAPVRRPAVVSTQRVRTLALHRLAAAHPDELELLKIAVRTELEAGSEQANSGLADEESAS